MSDPENVVPDMVLSSQEMRRATGIDDLDLLDGMPSATVPEGYRIATNEEIRAVIFLDSGQDFLNWCRPFLAELARKGTVRAACEKVGINRREYRLAIQWQHGFAEACDDALADFSDRLDEQAIGAVLPWGTDKETGEEVILPPFEKAYNLLWRMMTGRVPERYGNKAQRPTKALSGNQKKFLTEAIIRSGFTRAEAESMVDLGAAAMQLAEGAQ